MLLGYRAKPDYNFEINLNTFDFYSKNYYAIFSKVVQRNIKKLLVVQQMVAVVAVNALVGSILLWFFTAW